MGLKKGLSILILFILIVIPMGLALDTPIQIKTQPNYAVTIRALDISGTGTLENGAFIDQIADASGLVKVTFSSDVVNTIDISIMIKNALGGTTVQFSGGPVQLINNNGEHIKTGWPVEIDATVNPPVLVKSGKPEGAEVPVASATNSVSVNVNVTDSDSTTDNSENTESSEDSKEISELFETTTDVEAETTGITGKAIDVGKSIFSSKITYSIMGILFLVLVIGFLYKNNIISLNLPKSKLKEESKRSEFRVMPRDNPKLRDAERKIEQAKRELDEIRNRDSSLQEARRRFEESKRELEKLEKG